MEINELKRAFMQGEAGESAALMQEILRGAVRAGLLAAMEAEVEELCGRKYHPKPESDYRRSGSEAGQAYINGTREAIRRPRVRDDEGEVALATYLAASDQRGIFEEVVAGLAEGVSSRGASRLSKGALSKSAASRMWVEKSREQLETLRNRPLNKRDWLAIVIDGVWLDKGGFDAYAPSRLSLPPIL